MLTQKGGLRIMRPRGDGLMAILRVGGRGQVTLPSGIREALGIREGRKMVCYVNEAGDIVLHPLPAPKSVDEVAGLMQGTGGRSIEEALEQAAGRYIEEWSAHEQPQGVDPHTASTVRRGSAWREAAPARDAS